MNWLSIVILVILAGCILNGFRKGMVRTLAAMMSLVVSLVLVSLANPYVATFLEEKTTVYEVTETKCREAFQSIAEKQTENVQQEFMQKMGVPENFSNTLRIGKCSGSTCRVNGTSDCKWTCFCDYICAVIDFASDCSGAAGWFIQTAGLKHGQSSCRWGNRRSSGIGDFMGILFECVSNLEYRNRSTGIGNDSGKSSYKLAV